MKNVNAMLRDGTTQVIEGEEGGSPTQAVRYGNIDEATALCGGCCSRATSHVYVNGASLALLPETSADEDAFLDTTAHRGSSSRREIPISPAHGGMTTTVTPERA